MNFVPQCEGDWHIFRSTESTVYRGDLCQCGKARASRTVKSIQSLWLQMHEPARPWDFA